jgi:N-acetylmuramoyl-L-alanine amidase
VRHNDAWARSEFAKAERMREALNGRPVGERTRREYQRVIDGYRRVYFGSPASSKADPSVVATAELLVEMGRRFDDNKILRSAVEEYRFLRKEYPGSKYRFDALFTVGEIYKDDLNDPDEAQKTFEDFLHRYPRNRLADDARAAIKEMTDGAAEKEPPTRKGRMPGAGKQVAGAGTGGRSADAAGNSDPATTSATNEASKADASATVARRNELPRVTGVRHWSTPDYTRVAIDVEQDVKFSASRLSSPDRIFFDLRNTKLASTLVGKTFDVDDGFLKKIRVAEFEPGRTRVVLEVDDLARYDAFLLPDPYRLIIDIHGKKSRASALAKAHGIDESTAQAEAQPATSDKSDATVAVQKGQHQKSEKEHAIVAKVEKEDLPAAETEDDDATAKPNETVKAPQDSSPDSSVVKTTVAVKGTDRRIPKTIVGPDDEKPANVARAIRGKKRSQKAASTSDRGDAQPVDTTRDAATSDGPAEVAQAEPQDSQAASDTKDNSLSRTSSVATSKGTSRRKKSKAAPSAAPDTEDLEAREARPTASGDRSLTRALGLKIGKIVIDAGHGGHDTGTIGPNGLLEKDVVLDVARRLGRLLESRLGAEVIYTRRDDTFIPLETRTAIANRAQADLFISIHANSSHDEDARGVETYYLNFTSSPEALEVAARENAVSEKSVHELQDLVKKIALKEKIEESREFAGDVQQSLYGGLSLNSSGIRNRGVKKAPFIVLIGANMPSILAEISFVSNPTDERKLGTSEHRQRIAESLYRGVSKYAGGLSGVKVAAKMEKAEGQ